MKTVQAIVCAVQTIAWTAHAPALMMETFVRMIQLFVLVMETYAPMIQTHVWTNRAVDWMTQTKVWTAPAFVWVTEAFAWMFQSIAWANPRGAGQKENYFSKKCSRVQRIKKWEHQRQWNARTRSSTFVLALQVFLPALLSLPAVMYGLSCGRQARLPRRN